MNGLLSLMFWTIFARLLIVYAGWDVFGKTFWMEMESYVIQLSYSTYYYFVIIWVFVCLEMVFC
jgi:hypothetical protein